MCDAPRRVQQRLQCLFGLVQSRGCLGSGEERFDEGTKKRLAGVVGAFNAYRRYSERSRKIALHLQILLPCQACQEEGGEEWDSRARTDAERRIRNRRAVSGLSSLVAICAAFPGRLGLVLALEESGCWIEEASTVSLWALDPSLVESLTLRDWGRVTWQHGGLF
jgi:hypothetical protein